VIGEEERRQDWQQLQPEPASLLTGEEQCQNKVESEEDREREPSPRGEDREAEGDQETKDE
jgi:hypothetical protein